MGLSYPSKVYLRATELGGLGFKAPEIERILKREFSASETPHQATIRRWIDPEYAERQRRGAALSTETRNWGWRRRLRRLQDLCELGIGFPAVAAVVSHDFGLQISGDQVERIYRAKLQPRTVKRLLGAPRTEAVA